MVFRSSRVRNSVANLAQSRLIDARSVSIIHESFSFLVIMLGIATILNLYCVCEIDGGNPAAFLFQCGRNLSASAA